MLRAPAMGEVSHRLQPLGESVGQVTCGFLQPTIEPMHKALPQEHSRERKPPVSLSCGHPWGSYTAQPPHRWARV